MSNFVVTAFYQFAPFPDFKDWQHPLKDLCTHHQIKGILLLAPEGINGTLSGPRAGIEAVLAFLKKDSRFAFLDSKESEASTQPFFRLRVRLKKEIVTLGVPEVDPNKRVGIYVQPEEWNELISDPDVIVIDTRNAYETKLGTFRRSLDPQTESFRDFPTFVAEKLAHAKQKKIALHCTGGIRCEKATSYLLNQGFQHVYHLKGGILKYLENISPAESLWEGECFVFDQRVTVTHTLQPGSYDLCHGCRMPLSEPDKKDPAYLNGIQCPHCYSQKSDKSLKRATERHHQITLSKARGYPHLGPKSS